jgi:hypothetical protein
MVTFMIKYFITQRMKKEGASHLLAPPAGCSGLDNGPIPHHLKHQWSQISTWLSLNHIRHHTYFKSSYVHIQMSHILHHHTMKLLLAFKSFQPRRPIVEIGSENWFAAGCQFNSKC